MVKSNAYPEMILASARERIAAIEREAERRERRRSVLRRTLGRVTGSGRERR